ncbi:MAG: hypothetical protein AAF389_00545 [Gemmatimonadota bacterium]
MGRVIGGALAGYALWSVLWVGGSALAARLFPDQIVLGEPTDSVPILLGYIVWSCVLSVAAGFVAARIGKERSASAVRGVAGLLLLTGIGVEVSAWALTPVWYHVVFLLLLVPLTLFGGKVAEG